MIAANRLVTSFRFAHAMHSDDFKHQCLEVHANGCAHD